MTEIAFLPNEKWAQIILPNNIGTKKKYAVSNLGRIISYDNTINDGKLIAKSSNDKWAAELTIQSPEKRLRLKVHKLVAQYFLPKPPENFTYVIHIDKDIANNNANNLMYANYNMYLQHIRGKNITKSYLLKLFVGETVKIIDEPFKLKKYAITNFGRLISYQSSIEDGTIIDGSIHKEGYKIWRYKINNQHKHKLIHRLVAECFLQKPTEAHKFVIHLDHNKLNNNVRNLQWATQEDVTLHSGTNETVIQQRRNITANYMKRGRGTKLTTGKVLLLKRILKEPNNPTRKRLIAKQFGISPMQLFRIQTGENWGWLNENM
ncbi:MAG: HNH endonuclease [Flavobacterium sp.]|nr:HNH endonuclease [Flavobacterium sp.]